MIRRALLPTILATLTVLAPMTAAFAAPPPEPGDDELLEMARAIPGFGGLFYDAGGVRQRVPAGSVGPWPPSRAWGRECGCAAATTSSRGSSPGSGRSARRCSAGPGWSSSTRTRRPTASSWGSPGERIAKPWPPGSPPSGCRARRWSSARPGPSAPSPAPHRRKKKPVPTATLRDGFRPVPAGVQIGGWAPGTLGFNAWLGDTFGFVLNSHCTGARDVVDGTRFYQGDPDDLIATEIADPPTFTTPPCAAGRKCRYSDSAFARYDAPRAGGFRQLARPSLRGELTGSITLNPAGSRFQIAGTAPALVGQVVNKIGRTTG